MMMIVTVVIMIMMMIINRVVSYTKKSSSTLPKGLTLSSINLYPKTGRVGRGSLCWIKPNVSCHLGLGQSTINDPVSIGGSYDIFLLKQMEKQVIPFIRII